MNLSGPGRAFRDGQQQKNPVRLPFHAYLPTYTFEIDPSVTKQLQLINITIIN